MTSLNIHQRLHAAQNAAAGGVDYIQREKKSGMRYSIVSHDAVTAKIRPVLHANGIVYYPIDVQHWQNGNRTEVRLTVRFANIENPEDHIDVPSLGYGIDDQDKGPGKAISYAVKYALLKTLGLETGDDPDEDQEVKHKPAANGTTLYRDDMDKAGAWKDWATASGKDCDAAHWLQSAANAIRELLSIDDLNRWQKLAANRHRIDALREHHEQRYEWLMAKIEDKREALKAKEAA